jgi:hypothetical protein
VYNLGKYETTRAFFTVFLQTFDLFQLVKRWWFTVFIISLCWPLVYHQLTHFEITHLTYMRWMHLDFGKGIINFENLRQNPFPEGQALAVA